MATDEPDGSLAELGRIGAEFGAEFVDALVRTAVVVRDLEQRFERHLAAGAASVTMRLVPFDPSTGDVDPDPRRARWIRATRCAVPLVRGERGPGVLLEVGDDSSRDRPYSRHERRLLTDIGFAPPRLVEPGTGSWSRALVGDECSPARVAQRAVWVARFRGLGGPLLPHDLAVRHGHQLRRTEWIVSRGSSSALTPGG